MLIIFCLTYITYGKEVNDLQKNIGHETNYSRTYETGTRSGKVIDAITNKPIMDALLAFTWDIRVSGPESQTEQAVQYETLTDVNGNYFVPNQKVTIEGSLALDLEPEHVLVYKKEYAWYFVHNNMCFIAFEPNLNYKYQKEDNIINLQPWDEKYSYGKNIGVIKTMRNYMGPKLQNAISEEVGKGLEEKAIKTGSRKHHTSLIRHKITVDLQAFQEGKINEAEYIEKLKTYLITDNVEAINLVAVELFKHRDDSGIEPLIKVLKDNLDRNEFNVALGGLRIIIDRQDLQGTEIITKRQEIVKEIEDWWQKNRGKESLWQTGEQRRREELYAELISSKISDKEKLEILNNLSQTKDKSASPYLIQLLKIKDQAANLYQISMQLLSVIGNNSTVETVKPMLYHPDIYVRRQAALTLNAFGDHNGVSIMILTLESKSRNSRSVANAVLKEITGQDFADEKSLRTLSEAGEKAVIEKWRSWWKQNRDALGIAEAKDFYRTLAEEDSAMQLRYAIIEEEEKKNPELPTFENSNESPYATFEQFRAALLNDDTEKAISLMCYPLNENYKKIFEKIEDRSDYARGLGKIYFDMTLGNIYYYEMVTEQDDGLFSFPIHFVQDSNDKWLITEF